METIDNLSNRGRFVKALMTGVTAFFAVVSYMLAIVIVKWNEPSLLNVVFSRDNVLSGVFIVIFWVAIDTWLNLNEVYRSRSYAYVVMFHVIEGVLGSVMLVFTQTMLGLPIYNRTFIILFGAISTTTSIGLKIGFYVIMRRMRKKGRNIKHVVFVCDKQGETLLKLILKNFEWGYKITALVGDEYIVEKYKDRFDTYSINSVDLPSILTAKVEELIYACDFDSMTRIKHYIDVCTDFGVMFRLCSSFFNRLSSNVQVRYFDTQAVLTICNTPTDYTGLLVKRVFDILASLIVIIVGMPFFLIVALLIKIDSKGPIFFKQRRSGLRGKVFNLYKFRTMVDGADKMKSELVEQNEMSGPVFKMTNDPRITRIGKYLRKVGVDEFPQFINVLRGDMSIIGPRPPIPSEVEKYERWQMRRLSMRPGITCLWQVSRERNSVTFDEWMRLDMEYIDNWSISLDVVIMLKTVRTMLRADGK
ncbi:MAG: sugar transferase [Bacteroidales bacterium]|nr:sugar transferase [Bacteroidales bacterium]